MFELRVSSQDSEQKELKLFDESGAVHEELFKICINGRGVTVYEPMITEGITHYTHVVTESLVASEYDEVEAELQLAFLSSMPVQQAKMLTDLVLVEANEKHGTWKVSTNSSETVVGELYATIDAPHQDEDC